jgi:hypothetical protein
LIQVIRKLLNLRDNVGLKGKRLKRERWNTNLENRFLTLGTDKGEGTEKRDCMRLYELLRLKFLLFKRVYQET